MTIWVISDGKPGHLNQSLGLVNALKKLIPVEVYRIDIEGLGFFDSWKKATSGELPRPDVVLGAGHKTHIPVLAAARKWKARSFLCMMPSLPVFLFDLCFVPYHDLASTVEELVVKYEQIQEGKGLNSHIFPTMGAMHRIVPNNEASKDYTLILIGGPSKFFSWDTKQLLKQLDIIAERTEGRIVLTTSRRTPPDVAGILKKRYTQMEIYPVEETDSEWVPAHLEHATGVWVTEDSVSMIFEAVGSGVFVGLLNVPKKAIGTPRVAAGIQLLLREGYVTSFAFWRTGKKRAYRNAPLREADRAAAFILERYPEFAPTRV